MLKVREGDVANLTIVRAGLANFKASVMYRFEFGGTSMGDFVDPSNESMLVFGDGERTKNISLLIWNDDIPETDEIFYVVLSNATGEFQPPTCLL